MNRKLVKGIGVNDLGSTILDGKQDPHYGLWTAILGRVSPSSKYSLWYSETTICEEWLYRSNFQEWLVSQPGYTTWREERFGKGYFNIDKDILSEGVSIYSSDTCALVPGYINRAFLLSKGRRTGNPLGVYYNTRPKHCKTERQKPYRAEMSGKFLGNFTTAPEAHKAWQIEKIKHLEGLVRDYDLESFKDIRIVRKFSTVIRTLSENITAGKETTNFFAPYCS